MRPWPLSSWWNFYPRPPRGGRRFPWSSCSFATRFLSTPSARRATYPPLPCSAISLHFYPRPPRGGRRYAAGRGAKPADFYPRPPRGGRRWRVPRRNQAPQISIHALREEGDADPAPPWCRLSDFYPRPPRGGRHSQHRGLCLHRGISIHALREEGDPGSEPFPALPCRFLSTPSARRATPRAPLDLALACHFYPRPPRGGRLHAACCPCSSSPISIHALREEGDQKSVNTY